MKNSKPTYWLNRRIYRKQLIKNAKTAHLQVCAELCKLSKPTKEDKHVKEAHQQVRDWQIQTKNSIKKEIQSQCLLIDEQINDIVRQCNDTKQKMENIKVLFISDVLACAKQIQNHVCKLQELELHCHVLRQNTEEWDVAISIQCNIDLTEHSSTQKGSASGSGASSASSSFSVHTPTSITSNSQSGLIC